MAACWSFRRRRARRRFSAKGAGRFAARLGMRLRASPAASALSILHRPTPVRRRVIQTGFWIFLVVFVSWAFFSLMRSFIEPILWAITLAVVFHPLFRRLRDRFGGKEGLAATLTTFIIFGVVLLPVAGILAAMVNEGLYLYEEARSGQVQAILQQLQGRLPRMQAFLSEYGVNMTELQTRLQTAVADAGQRVAGSVGSALSNVAGIVVSFFMMLYLVYFFLKDGYRILGRIIEAMPLGDEHEWRMLARFGTTARATIKGSVVVGAVQGLIGGIAFAVLGIHGPIFWGVMMAVASLIPSIGTALVWVPAAVYFFATGETSKAITLVVVGGGIISMVDNFLRPVLVGRDTGVPDWIVLLVSFGGIAVFGLSGLVIGPIVAALFLTVWEQFSEEFDYGEDLHATVVADAQSVAAGGEPGPTAKAMSPAATRIAARAARDLEAASAAEAERSSTPSVSAFVAQALSGDAPRPASGSAASAEAAAETVERTSTRVEAAADRAEVAADKAEGAAAEASTSVDSAEAAVASAQDAASTAQDAAAGAADAADDVQMSAEFIRQRVEGAPSPVVDLDAIAADDSGSDPEDDDPKTNDPEAHSDGAPGSETPHRPA